MKPLANEQNFQAIRYMFLGIRRRCRQELVCEFRLLCRMNTVAILSMIIGVNFVTDDKRRHFLNIPSKAGEKRRINFSDKRPRGNRGMHLVNKWLNFGLYLCMVSQPEVVNSFVKERPSDKV
uniref:Uncharacterized protein n=1 Tax=Romanomermis culicivorax TaxID=13658 RepID=A0A915I237_ROMCU